MVISKSTAIAPFSSILSATSNFTDASYNPNFGDGIYTIDSGVTWTTGSVSVANGDTLLSFSIDPVTIIDLPAQALNFDVSQIMGQKDIQQLIISSTEAFGDLNFIADYSDLSDLRIVNCTNINLSLASCVNTSALWGNGSSLTGDLADIASNVGLIIFYIDNTQVTGDLASLLASKNTLRLLRLLFGANSLPITVTTATLRQFTELVLCNVANRSGVGNINDLADLTNMQSLQASGSGMTGAFDALVALTDLRLLDFSNLSLTQAELDTSLEAFYNSRANFTQTSKTLMINGQTTGDVPSGTPGDPVSANTGYGWITGLQGAGWTVVV